MTFYSIKGKFSWCWWMRPEFKKSQYPGYMRANVRQSDKWFWNRDLSTAHSDDRYLWLDTFPTPGIFQFWGSNTFREKLKYEFDYFKWLLKTEKSLWELEKKLYINPLNYYKLSLVYSATSGLLGMYLLVSYFDYVFMPASYYPEKFATSIFYWLDIAHGFIFVYMFWTFICLLFPSMDSYWSVSFELIFGTVPAYFIFMDWYMWDVLSFGWMMGWPIFYFCWFTWTYYFQNWAYEEEDDESVNPDQVEKYLWNPLHPAFYMWDHETSFNASGATYYDWLVLGDNSVFLDYEYFDTYTSALMWEPPLMHEKSHYVWTSFIW